MTQLVFIENNKAVTDSLAIAEVFGKEHKNVKRDIENQIEKLMDANEIEFIRLNFERNTYLDSRGRTQEKFNLSEEAFTIIAMSYVTPEAMKMKVKFIQEFKRMREQIENNKVKILDDRQIRIESMRLTLETAERQDEMQKVLGHHDRKILELEHKVEEQITLTSGEQRRLQKGIATKVYEICNDPDSRPSLFRELHREIKDRFGVASYKDLKKKELHTALRYIENWIPRKAS
jgi:Rha family phage regulatory protein